MQNQNINPEQAYRTLVIIWLALLFSQFLFLVLIYFVKREVFRFDFTKPLLGEQAVIIIAFALVAILNLVISLVLKKKFLAQAIAERNVAFVQTAMIAGCALCEAIALFGLMLVFVANYQYFFFWSALGILGMLLHFPRRENVFAASYKK